MNLKSDELIEARLEVLLVDDEPDVVEEMAFGFSRFGFSVNFTTDPLHALEQMRSRPGPLVLVTDMRMPVMNGEELARTALAERAQNGILGIIFISGHSHGNVIRQAFVNEPVVFFRKPFSLEDISAAIRQVAARAFSDQAGP